MSRLIRHTPAKINLGLELLGKRDDGYHEINTLFVAINLCDTLEVFAAEELILECSPSLNILPEENIVIKAARELQKFAGVKSGAFLRLTKKIPSGAGLGGGSSNAASALQLLNKLWKIALHEVELRTIAARLGSDVPFFMGETAAIGRGRGEILTSVGVRLSHAIVVIRPKVSVATAWAYKSAVPKTFHAVATDYPAIVRDVPVSEWRNYIFNDFEQGVFAHHHTIAATKQALYDAGAEFALMSGSGSCVFGLFADHNRAQKVAANFSSGFYCRQYTASDISASVS